MDDYESDATESAEDRICVCHLRVPVLWFLCTKWVVTCTVAEKKIIPSWIYCTQVNRFAGGLGRIHSLEGF